MDRSTSTIAGEIAAFQPSGGNWRPLDALINELWSVGEPAQVIPQLFSVFERYPSEDGAGVFWAIVHGLESLPNYEPCLVESFSASQVSSQSPCCVVLRTLERHQ